MMTTGKADVGALLAAVAARASAAGVFGSVRVEKGVLRCDALASGEPAEYRVFEEKGALWVSLVTSARWLSQSIEADLVNTGDKIEELLEEELVDLGWKKEWGPARLSYQHFRDDTKMYTFRTAAPVKIERAGDPQSAEIVATVLLGYEQTFRPLGDMETGEDE
jgi:hypothetical protein